MLKSFHTLAAITFAILAVATVNTRVEAAVIANLDFTNGNWTSSLSASGGTNDSSVTATTITADKSGSAGGVRVTVALTGAISTIGFENITISFFGSAEDFEWDGNLQNPVSSSDGLRIVGSGVEINANSLNDLTGTDAETEFSNGTTFPTLNFGSDFSFDPSVDNSSITSLEFILQVNAGTEVLSVSNVQILGDPIVVVPEPSAVGLIFFGTVGWIARRRRS